MSYRVTTTDKAGNIFATALFATRNAADAAASTLKSLTKPKERTISIEPEEVQS